MTVSAVSKVEMDIGTASATVDVSSLVQEINVQRGRSGPLDPCQPGICDLTLRNDSGEFDPESPSASYPTLDVGAQVVVSMTINAVDVALFTGFIDSWDVELGSGSTSVARFHCVDGLSRLANISLAACEDSGGTQPPTFPQQTVAERVDALLACVDVDTSNAVWSGTVTTTGCTGNVDSRVATQNLLSELQLMERTEHAIAMFVNRAGAFTFKGKHGAGANAATLTDKNYTTASDLWVRPGARMSQNRRLVYNQIAVYRDGEDVPESASDNTSQGSYNVRSLRRDTLHRSAGESQALADYLLTLYKSPTPQLGGVTVLAHSVNNNSNLSDAQRNAQLTGLAGLEPGDVVTVKLNSTGAQWTTANKVIVDSVNHRVPGTDKAWTVQIEGTATVSNLRATQYFELDDATFGELDQATYVLAGG